MACWSTDVCHDIFTDVGFKNVTVMFSGATEIEPENKKISLNICFYLKPFEFLAWNIPKLSSNWYGLLFLNHPKFSYYDFIYILLTIRFKLAFRRLGNILWFPLKLRLSFRFNAFSHFE